MRLSLIKLVVLELHGLFKFTNYLEIITMKKKLILLSIIFFTFVCGNVNAEDSCTLGFGIEGTNDTRGFYSNKENVASWTIHFSESDEDFIIFQSIKGMNGDTIIIDSVDRVSDCVFKITMKDIRGEIIPTWTLKYNKVTKVYDLYSYEYDANIDSWDTIIYLGDKL
jgi:hypothetical protein